MLRLFFRFRWSAGAAGSGRTKILPLLFVALLIPSLTLAQAPEWNLVKVPDAWRSVPSGKLAPIEGWSWYRALVFVPESWQDGKVILHVEALDDARATLVNGATVGATGTFPPQFRSGLGEKGRYELKTETLRPGQLNTIAIRVHQNDPRPNFSVAPPVLVNETAKQGLRMEGHWQYRPGDDMSWAAASAADFGVDPAKLAEDSSAKGVFHKVDTVDDIERYVSRRTGDNDPFPPKEAEKRFKVPADLECQLVVGDPEIAQPLCMTWDAKGRMWLIEYRQYPEPAGLKMVSRDVFLRSVYDKVPPPPPHHFKGRDRISIHEDTDGDGVYDRHKVFIDGLSLASSVAVGRGGAYVTNPPYLLFYPDRDGDDVPDGDPEVLLEGFGIEDSHSVINSLRFGPDGWLYGGQGSTVTGNVKKYGSNDPPIASLGQLIWRYHPELKRYEIFAEGGGNTFGVEINAKGHVFSGHNGGDTRGFHYVQGGYSQKGFGKHGPLSNPYAFGYFSQMKHHSVPRFTHNFIIYEAPVLPDEYRGRLFGVEPLQGQVVMSHFEPDKSSFQTRDINRPVTTDDQWFRPVDIKAGPDGCIYVADMYEQRIDHSSHYAGRIDRTNGRVYRLKPKSLPVARVRDLGAMTNEQLLNELRSENKWDRQTAVRLIGDRALGGTAAQQAALKELAPRILDRAQKAAGQEALELLWALHAAGGLNDQTALELLHHADQYVRAWTVRLLCDHYQVAAPIARALADLAGSESYIEVRKQLASSARRLPTDQGLPIIKALLRYDEDAEDIHQPLLLWWAIEAKATGEGREKILALLLGDAAEWQRPLVRQHLAERLMKRYALAGSREELLAAAKLLSAAPDKTSSDVLLKGFEEAFKGRSLAGIPEELVQAIAKTGGGSTALKLRQGDAQAIAEAGKAVVDAKTSRQQRVDYLQIMGEIRRSEFIPVLLQVATTDKDEAVVSSALTALMAFDDLRVGQEVVKALAALPPGSRPVAESLLSSRRVWAEELLEAVESGRVAKDSITEAALRRILLHNSSRIQELVAKHWGEIAGATTEEMKREVDRLTVVLREGSGNPKLGKRLFMENCGKCHTLFAEGGQIGPDLTAFKRDNVERMLISIVNPSVEIREGFENFVVETSDGRVVNGFLADKDSQVVVIRGVDGQNLIIRRDEIEEMRAVPKSVMPEGALSKLTPQQIRDLFAYLRSTQPVNY